MSNLELPSRSLTVVIIEASICIALNITSLTGNSLVCIAAYRNLNLRSTTNLYIIALAVSDLLVATIEIPLTSSTLIVGKWDFGNALCQIQGFVAFSYPSDESQIVHYCLTVGLLFFLPLCIGTFSYYKIFLKTNEHQQNVVSSLQSRTNNGALNNSVRETNLTRMLFIVAVGFLCSWIPMWAIVLWFRFSPETCPRIAALVKIFIFFLSASVNPIIYAFTNGVFRKEFRKLLCCCRERVRIVPIGN